MRNVERAERIARRMDAALRIPGTGIRVGYDSMLGLVPGIGDTLALAPSAYIVKLAYDSGAPPHILGRMAANLGIDWLIGLVPLIGDVFDVGWKANLRNAALLRDHVETSHIKRSRDSSSAGSLAVGTQCSDRRTASANS